MSRIRYEGFVIDSKPYQLAEDDRWCIKIFIERHTGEGLHQHNFETGTTFATREEAVVHGFNFGRQIIDGKVAGCTPP